MKTKEELHQPHYICADDTVVAVRDKCFEKDEDKLEEAEDKLESAINTELLLYKKNLENVEPLKDRSSGVT